ncbi:MAG: polysaccharide deacetylase family protein [Acidimicrobiales bacterium]
MALIGASLVATPGSAEAAPVALRYAYQAPSSGVSPGQRVIALSFDDGPSPLWTPQVLSVLERYQVPATFFEIGSEVNTYPGTSAAVAAAGYPVEDHTYTHPDLALLSPAQVAGQISQTQQAIQSATGTTPACVRPPYNDWNGSVLNQIDRMGLATMSYSIDPRDWSRPGVAAIVRAVVGAAIPGGVVDMHDGGGNRSETVAALPAIITTLEGEGYQFVSICGSSAVRSEVYGFGSAPPPAAPFTSPAALVGEAAAPDGRGYWTVSSRGQVFTAGTATAQGDLSALALNRPIVGMAADPATGGYWLVGADGGVFSFDTPFYGSTGGIRLNQPVVGMAATPDGGGYWLVAADGGVFSFGDAAFYGSTGGIHLNQPVVGMAADTTSGGYWLVARDGGVFSFAAPFYGSRAGQTILDRFYGILPVDSGAGYFLMGQRPG